MKKKTVSHSVEVPVANAIDQFAIMTGYTKSHCVSKILMAFFKSYNGATLLESQEDYEKVVKNNTSIFAATSMGTLMNIVVAIDFADKEDE